jgi:hypothetical protein
VTQALARVECPVLVTHFELNAVTGPDIARRLAATAPDGRMFLPRNLPEALQGYHDFLEEETARPAVAAAGLVEGALRIFLVARSSAAPRMVELLVSQHGGMPVTSMDGTTTSLFETVVGAMGCAKALAQAASAAIGIHAGEPGDEPRDHADPALVTAVLAAGLAERGQVVVSNVVRELGAGKGFGFDPLNSGVPGEDDELIRLFTLR